MRRCITNMEGKAVVFADIWGCLFHTLLLSLTAVNCPMHVRWAFDLIAGSASLYTIRVCWMDGWMDAILL
jgi:hypothetical protein